MTASRSRSVWLDWQPKQELLEGHPKMEPPKPPKPNTEGFEGSILGCSPTFDISPDSAKWVRDFHFWVLERCRFVDGYWSPPRDLHADFVSWNVTRNCNLFTFSTLLDEAGFYVETVRGIAWCYGLMLAHLLTPEMSEARRPGRRDAEGRLVMDLTKEEE